MPDLAAEQRNIEEWKANSYIIFRISGDNYKYSGGS